MLAEPLNDITARHLAKVVESSDDAIVSKDLNSIITSWNPGAERIFGYTAEEAIGKSIRMIIPARSPERRRRGDGQDSRGRRSITTRPSASTRAAHSSPISLTVSPIRDEAGTIIGASKIARDVTERARLQAQTSEYADQHAEAERASAPLVASTLDRETIVQKVTDTATELTHAEFGAFFYNVRDAGERRRLHALRAVGRAEGSVCGFSPSARDGDVSRRPSAARASCASTTSRRIRAMGRTRRIHGMPPGHLPVQSYLAVPVKGINGDVLGGLFFGHSRPGDVYRAARAPGRRHGGVGVGGARERAPLRRSAGRQPHQGRFPGGPVARAAHAAQRHPRLRAVAARQHAAGEQVERGARNRRAQLALADADRRRRARRVAHRLGQDPPRRPARRIAPASSTTRSPRVQPGADAKSVQRADAARSAHRTGLGRSRSPAAGGLEPAVERGQVHAQGRPRAGAGSSASTRTSSSSSATPASASARIFCRSCSSGSGRPTPARRARPAASASAWRSSGISSRCTAAPFTPRAPAWIRARPSPSSCR